MLEDQGIAATPKAIADDLIQPANRIRVMLHKMKGNGLVRANNGVYTRVKDTTYDFANGTNSSNCTNPANTANGLLLGTPQSIPDDTDTANGTKTTPEASLQGSMSDDSRINSISGISRDASKKNDTLPLCLNPQLPDWEQELRKKVPGKSKNWKLVDLVERRAAWYQQHNIAIPRLPRKWEEALSVAKPLEKIKEVMGY